MPHPLRHFVSKVFFAVAAALTAFPVLAASTWTFHTSNCGGVADGSKNASLTCTSGAPVNSVTVTAWSASGVAGTSAFGTAQVGIYNGGGLGVTSNGSEPTTSPHHALDNFQNLELLALDFGSNKLVDLDSLSIGYKPYDADLTILRYKGSTTGTTLSAQISGKTVTSLATGGSWELVSYGDLVTGTAKAITTSPINNTSSWWLVSAYNTAFGSCAGCTNASTATTSSTNAANDYVKLLTVAGNVSNKPPGVPEPGSLALMGMALAGMMVVRSRKGLVAEQA